jgi:hypothetical protein
VPAPDRIRPAGDAVHHAIHPVQRLAQGRRVERIEGQSLRIIPRAAQGGHRRHAPAGGQGLHDAPADKAAAAQHQNPHHPP